MAKLAKDIQGREYIFNEEKNMREYACSNLWIKEKELSFHKYVGAAVEIFNNEVCEYFTFTPQFGKFEGFTDLFDYVEFWLKENNIELTEVSVKVDEMSALIYKIDLVTMDLGETKERISGSDCITYEYRKIEKSFFDPNNDKKLKEEEWGWYEVIDEGTLEDYEYDDIDPQF